MCLVNGFLCALRALCVLWVEVFVRAIERLQHRVPRGAPRKPEKYGEEPVRTVYDQY